MPAIYHEGSWLGNATDPEVLVKDTVGWTGKNLLKNTATTQTINGVTFTVNADKSVTINGTATSDATFVVNDNFVIPEDDYILSTHEISDGNNIHYSVVKMPGNTVLKEVKGTDEQPFTVNYSGYSYLKFTVWVRSGTTVSNKTAYPMLRRADITDPTYEPYHESVEVMYEEEIHGVNLIPYPYWDKTVTRNGITFTMNSDGSVTANGTATRAAGYNILVGNGYGYAKNKYIGCIYTALTTQGSNSTYRILADYSETGTSWKTGDESFNMGEGLVIRNYPYVQIHLYISSGATVNNLVFKPMLRKADIEDSTYRPYNPQAIQNQLNAQGVLGAKNLIPNKWLSATLRGITFTANADGSVTANGTATADAEVSVDFPVSNLIKGESYILNGCPSGGSESKYTVDIFGIPWNAADFPLYRDKGAGVAFTVPSNMQADRFRVRVLIANGQTVNNLVFKPMLRLASDPDDTYQPYAMTNRELTEKKINIADLKTVVSASSDFTDFKTRIASL